MKKQLLLLICLAGCAVGPDYQPPENQITDAWASHEDSITSETPLVEWWKLFEDEILSRYMTQAAENNCEVLAAESRIMQARALRQIAASSFFPQIGADVNATRTYFSKNGPVFAIGPSTGSLPGTVSAGTGLPFQVETPQTQNLYNAIFDASWEIDLFGKTRRTVEAADAQTQSTLEKRNDILLSVLAEIALNYIELRSYQQSDALLQNIVSLLEQKVDISQKQLECGYVSRVEYEDTLSKLASKKALLPDIQAQIHKRIYTLSILTGQVPETLLKELIVPKNLPFPPEKVCVGLRSDLLRRRPDIRKVERDLAAATASIGVAVASFFPALTLVGDGGVQSLEIKNLFSMASRTWALGGDLLMPVFQGGKLMGNLKAKRAETAAAAHTYQQTLLLALEETETALISYTKELKAWQAYQDARENKKHLEDLSGKRYEKGLVDKWNFLAAQEQLALAEQDVLKSHTSSLLKLVTLYKALGGGWQIKEPGQTLAP